MAPLISQKEFDDFIFSRLYAKTHFVVIESYPIKIMDDLREFSAAKGMSVEGNFTIFKFPKGFPTISVIDKNIISKEMICTYLEVVLKDNKKAEILRNSKDVTDMIAMIDVSDIIAPTIIIGMDTAFRKWTQEHERTHGSEKTKETH